MRRTKKITGFDRRARLMVYAVSLLMILVIDNSFAQVDINWEDEKQTIHGFGATSGGNEHDHEKFSEMADILFDKNTGLGLSSFRVYMVMGLKLGETEPTSLKSWHQGLVDWIEAAKARGVNKYWSSSWTAPKWMKDNNDLVCGYLLSDMYDNYAEYLADWYFILKNDLNIDLYGISPQNEPGCKPWESMEWTSSDFNVFIRDYLGPTFSARDVNTNIIVPEETAWYNVDNFTDVMVNDNVTNDYVDIVAGHGYWTSTYEDYTDDYNRPVWMTEMSNNTEPNDASMARGLEWADKFHRLLVNAQVSTIHHWRFVDWSGDEPGLIQTYGSKTSYTVNKFAWTLGNYSRFVRPGWKRIGVSGTSASGVLVSSFKNPADDKFAVVIINTNSGSKSVTLNFNGFTSSSLIPYRTSSSENLSQLSSVSGGSSVTVNVAGESVTTFTGTGTPSTGTGTNLTVRAKMVSGSSDNLELRVDDNVVKTWTISGSSYANYTHNVSSGSNVKLYFQDNGTDIQVDYLDVGSNRYQAEGQAVNTSVWENGSCGGDYSEVMHCPGYIDFGDVLGGSGTTDWYRLENNGRDWWLRDNEGTPQMVDQSYTGTWPQWQIVDVDGTHFYLENRRFGTRLRANGNTPEIVSGTYSAQDAQWKQVSSGVSGYYRIENREYGNWLQASGSNDGVYLAPTSATGNWTRWKFVFVESTNGRTAGKKQGRVVVTEKIEEGISVYPNPSTGHVTLTNIPADASVKVLSISGQKVADYGRVEKRELNIEGLKKGMYLIRINSASKTDVLKLMIR